MSRPAQPAGAFLLVLLLFACGERAPAGGRAVDSISFGNEVLTIRRDSTGHVVVSTLPRGMRLIDPSDTAAYADAASESKAVVAACRPPVCKAVILSGPAAGQFTFQLDSANGHKAYWEEVPEPPIAANQRHIDSVAWDSTLTKWETSRHPPLLLVDSAPRSYAYVRQHVRLEDVWGMEEVSAAEAKRLSKDPAATHGAVVITTKAHAPSK